MPNIAKRSPGVRALKPLTDQQRRFVEEYLVDCNASAAAVRAGYSRKSSGLYSTMMSNRAVVAAVEDGLARKRARSDVDADRVLAELARVAFANVLDFFGPDGRVDLGRLSRDAGAAVARVSVEYYEAAPPRSPKASRPPREGEGRRRGAALAGPTPLAGGESPSSEGEGIVTPSTPAVKRVTLTLADKVAALRQISRNLGLERCSGGKDEAARAEGEEDDRLEINQLYTGVPREGNPLGLHEWLTDRHGRYVGELVRPPSKMAQLTDTAWDDDD